ncbi:YdcF family protein [Mycobacterium sp. NPDC050551]|uniref:YdcF family protein n=1 Tax=Mycobacterium sp. NPDC050551 TaxID=3155407 RepID=UPI00342DB2D8
MRGDRRRATRLLIAGCLALLIAVAAGIPVYVRPQTDPLRHADAILVLGGQGGSRYRVGLDLASRGWAADLVVSNPEDAAIAWRRDYCASPPPRVTMHCFVPDPGTTKGEGRELRRLADRHGWKSVIVVTFRPHISRARFILEQCFDGELTMVASPTGTSAAEWAWQYTYQTAGYLRAVAQPGC